MADQSITIQVPDAAPVSAPNAGYRSTEFGAIAVAAVALAAGAVPAQYAPLVAGLASVYAACRTLLKAAHALGYAKNIPDLPDVPPGGSATTITTTTAPVQP